MIQIDFWGNGNNWSIEVVDYICDDDNDDDDDEDNPGCWGNSGIIGALAPPRIWDYLPNLLSLHQILQGSGIIGATKDLDLGLFAQLAFSSESENYFWIWDLGLFAQPRIWDFFQTCLLFTRVTRDTRASKDLGLLVPPRILNYLPNLLSLQHQSQKIIYVFFSSLNQPRLLLEMARITPFDAMNIIAWSSNSQMA